MKQHPFFNDVDFEKVSSKKFKGVHELLKKRVTKAWKEKTEDLDFDYFHEFCKLGPSAKGGDRLSMNLGYSNQIIPSKIDSN